MSTPIAVTIVVVLLLVGLGIVSSQLFQLRDWLNKSPPPSAHPDHPDEPAEPAEPDEPDGPGGKHNSPGDDIDDPRSA